MPRIAHKVNFCKFTNETRLAIEDASANSGQRYLAAVNGTAAGGGYELALACDHIMLVDDRRSAVSLPEVPLLAVLPGTGGLTRLTDKRKVRRDLADMFCTTEEGARGRRALDWRLVDEFVPPSSWEERVRERALALAAAPTAPTIGGVELPPLDRKIAENGITYRHVGSRSTVRRGVPHHRARPGGCPPTRRHPREAPLSGRWRWRASWTTRSCICASTSRNSALIVFRSEGDPAAVVAADALLDAAGDWFVREVRLLLQRVFKRIDVTARSLFALIEPGSCFAGFLAELVFASDRALMFAGTRAGDNRGAGRWHCPRLNFGAYPMGNGLDRLATRFLGEPESLERAEEAYRRVWRRGGGGTGSRHRQL